MDIPVGIFFFGFRARKMMAEELVLYKKLGSCFFFSGGVFMIVLLACFIGYMGLEDLNIFWLKLRANVAKDSIMEPLGV